MAEAYLEILDAATTGERRKVLLDAQRRYCPLDTLVIICLVQPFEASIQTVKTASCLAVGIAACHQPSLTQSRYVLLPLFRSSFFVR